VERVKQIIVIFTFFGYACVYTGVPKNRAKISNINISRISGAFSMIKKENQSSFDALLNDEYFRDHASHGNGRNGLQKWFSMMKKFSRIYF
jgi:hypothetical protein